MVILTCYRYQIWWYLMRRLLCKNGNIVTFDREIMGYEGNICMYIYICGYMCIYIYTPFVQLMQIDTKWWRKLGFQPGRTGYTYIYIYIYIWEINDSRVVTWIEIDGEMGKLGNWLDEWRQFVAIAYAISVAIPDLQSSFTIGCASKNDGHDGW